MAITLDETRELIRQHGDCNPQDEGDWSGSIELPKALAEFYSKVGPNDVCIEGYGNSTTIPSLKNLWGRQEGYRWNGITNEPLDDWPANWLVVADEAGDPYIFEIKTNKILHAQHGTGEWDADYVYPDINTMAACIATLGSLVASSDFEDEDGYVNQTCLTEAVERIATIIGDKDEAESIIEMAGWE